MERIIQKMTASVQEGKQQFEIALKPEYLGKLSIKLEMDNDGIKAHIKASDTSVKGMIADQLPALQEALKEKGITVTHIEVTYERPAFDSQQSHQQNWQNNSGKKAIRYAIADLGGIAYQTMPDASELFIRNSSVEFQA
jgi:flagellar hook-length control protein FliK